ncbi:uncharacterized protein LOC128861092 isoform X2 [Anastrepha ludens]|uniref:uncharacterized protein LOC128861092 isoform X2 n=1 Tax=Anastrepha ludens TaxID=28586 RepID=UPI0023AF39B2|nr:uncharacterized protein LOC128861092 isoform X2 [Anastrepha ludens]
MDALSASSTFANTSDTNTSNNVTKTKASKESIVSTATSPPSSLRSTLDSSPLTSTDPIVIPAIIEPPSPARSSRASSCSAHSRLRVASTDSDTPGGEMSVSGGSQHGAALDMKIKASAVSVASVTAAAAAVELLQGGTPSSQTQSQKIKKLVRRNASDKLRLIQMVHDNPILWDSRLPNFKGAEEEKNRAWEMIGKEFNAPGRRVARAFKSLRESYRRELAHVKLMGNGFKPKWSLYDAMDFLRDVIRERKGGSHAVEQAAIGLNLSAFSHHLSNNNNNNSKSALKLSALHSSFNESALNLSKCAPGLNMSHEDYYYYVKPELDMAAAHPGGNVIGIGGNTAVPSHPMPAHQAQQQQQQQHLHSAAHDSRVSSTRNDSATQHSTTFDDLDASSVRSGDEASVRNADMSNQGSDEVEELEAIDADFPYPLILDANSPRSMSAAGVNGGNAVVNGGASKRKRRELNGDTIDGTIDDEDDYEGQMLQQHRHLRQQNGGVGGGSGGGGGLGGASGYMLDIPPPQTVREVLNLKFCGFIAAKLNSMEDTEADNLMNKILMLLVQTQTSEGK